jgi:transcriptional regulator with GAF, ATPase, and Fis domain
MIAALLELCAAHAEDGQPAATFRALDRVLQECLGHRLMTILRIDPDEAWSERIYTSRPHTFSSQDRKSLDAAPQMRRVIAAGRPVIVDGDAAVRAAFPDHERIFALGCACVLNVPVRWRARTIANLNLLGAAGAYSEKDAVLAQLAGHLCLPALLID